MYNTLLAAGVLAFPTIGISRTTKSVLTFPTVWRSEYNEESTIPAGEVIYLIDKDGNLLVDASGNFLTVAR